MLRCWQGGTAGDSGAGGKVVKGGRKGISSFARRDGKMTGRHCDCTGKRLNPAGEG